MNKDNNNKIKLNSSQLYKEIITIEDYLNSVLPNLEDKNEEEENLINKNHKNKKVTFQNEQKVRNLILDLPNRKKKISNFIYLLSNRNFKSIFYFWRYSFRSFFFK